MDMLADKINGREVRETLRNLPKDASSIYDTTMERVKGQPNNRWKLAKHIFTWVTFAYRPLTLEELQHALAVSLHSEMTKLEDNALVEKDVLTSVCAGLVVVDAESSIVRLVRK